jgi:hypothetical protein
MLTVTAATYPHPAIYHSRGSVANLNLIPNNNPTRSALSSPLCRLVKQLRRNFSKVTFAANRQQTWLQILVFRAEFWPSLLHNPVPLRSMSFTPQEQWEYKGPLLCHWGH